MTMDTAEFTKRTIIVLALALVPVLVWFLFDVVLIILGAVLVALLLQLGAEPLRRWLRLPHSIALILSGMMIVAALAGTVHLFGTRVGSQLQEVFHLVSEAQTSVRHTLQGSELGKLLLSHIEIHKLAIGQVLTGFLTVSATFIGSLLVLVVAGVYLVPTMPKR